MICLNCSLEKWKLKPSIGSEHVLVFFSFEDLSSRVQFPGHCLGKLYWKTLKPIHCLGERLIAEKHTVCRAAADCSSKTAPNCKLWLHSLLCFADSLCALEELVHRPMNLRISSMRITGKATASTKSHSLKLRGTMPNT